MTERRRGFRKPVAAFFFAATWLALIFAIVTDTGTLPIVLHALAAVLGLAAVVIAWRWPVDPPEGG
jgi:Flp pilus assembly protein TadB